MKVVLAFDMGKAYVEELRAAFPEEDSPLWDAPNMWISPHVSAESVQLIERRKAIFKENLRRYLAAEELLYVCDTEKGY